MRGDILHVVQQSDQYWWQAYREGEEDQSLAGLIPSSHFHVMRENIKRKFIDNPDEERTQMCACRYVRAVAVTSGCARKPNYI